MGKPETNYMPEPRRWTLHGATDDLDGQGMPIRLAAYCDPHLHDGECVRVIEDAPVEAELERLRSQIEFWKRRYETQHKTVHAMEDEIARLRKVEAAAIDVCAAEWIDERVAATNKLRDALEG